MRNRWTIEEEEFLRENWGTKSDTEIGKMLGKSTQSVCDKRTEKGWVHPTVKFSKVEVEKLRNLYPILSWEELQKEFPNRTVQSLRSVAESNKWKRGTIQHFWSSEEIEILRKLYKSASWQDLKSALPKRNKSAINGKASSLKLKRKYNWSNEDIEKLKKYFGTLDWESLMKMFPERTKIAIIGKAEKLHLSSNNYRWKRKWLITEDNILREFYSFSSKEELLKKLPKRNWSQITVRASYFKIKKERINRLRDQFTVYYPLINLQIKEFLKSKKNLSSYIRSLIEKDMEREKK